MTAPAPRLSGLDLTEITWRGRAIRYVVIYLALAVALVGVRALTQDIRPTLRAAQDQEATLLTSRNDLAVRVQTLENPQRIRDWAFANGMIRFAEAPKETGAITPLPPLTETAAASSSGPPESSVSPSSVSSSPASSSPASSSPVSSSPVSSSPEAPSAQPSSPVPDNTVEVRTQWK